MRFLVGHAIDVILVVNKPYLYLWHFHSFKRFSIHRGSVVCRRVVSF